MITSYLLFQRRILALRTQSRVLTLTRIRTPTNRIQLETRSRQHNAVHQPTSPHLRSTSPNVPTQRTSRSRQFGPCAHVLPSNSPSFSHHARSRQISSYLFRKPACLATDTLTLLLLARRRPRCDRVSVKAHLSLPTSPGCAHSLTDGFHKAVRRTRNRTCSC